MLPPKKTEKPTESEWWEAQKQILMEELSMLPDLSKFHKQFGKDCYEYRGKKLKFPSKMIQLGVYTKRESTRIVILCVNTTRKKNVFWVGVQMLIAIE